MRFLHTSDWHLGKTLAEFPLLEDQKLRLQEILAYAKENSVDALLISGDIYDRSIPPADAVELFDDFLNQAVFRDGLTVYIVSGNHDGAVRFASGSRFYEKQNVYICSSSKGKYEIIHTEDGSVPLDIVLLPWMDISESRAALENPDIHTAQDVYSDRMKEIAPQLRADAEKILVSHGFFSALSPEKALSETVFSRSERQIGGVDLVDSHLFDDFDYAAFGHLHIPRRVGRDTARYSGSLFPYSISEADQDKGFVDVTVSGKGKVTAEFIPFKTGKKLHILRGSFDELLMQESGDYIYAEITDDGEILDAAAKLRRGFPNLLGLRFVRQEGDALREDTAELRKAMTPEELFASFYEYVENSPLEGQRKETADSMIEEIISSLKEK